MVPWEIVPNPTPLSCVPAPQGQLLWAAVQDVTSLILLPILGCHPSVCQSLGAPPAQYKILAFTAELSTAEKWELWGLPLSRWGLALSCVVLVQKEARLGREGVQGLAGVCCCPGSQHGEWWGGQGQLSFTS